MDVQPAGELEGQTSINELLDEPVGTLPLQLSLPIHFHLAETAPTVGRVS